MPPTGASTFAMRAWRLGSGVLAAAWLAVAGPAHALDPAIPTDHYTVVRWSADDGLPHSQIHDIGQSPDGFLWVTTWEGTVRFDGLTFSDVERLQQASGARPASRVLWRDGDGSMLVGVDGPGLLRVPAQGPARPACADLPALRVSQLADGGQDGPWMVTDEGLYRLQPDGRCVRVPGGDSLAGRTVNALLPQDDGSVWLGLRRGLYRWQDGRIEPLGERLGLPAGEVRALATGRDGETWVAGEQGVWRQHGGRLQRMRSERAEGLLSDRAGALWVTATDSAVLRYWRGQWQRLDEHDGVVGYATGALFEGREGLVWFGTTHGLFRIADGPVRGIRKQPGLPSEYIRSVLQTRDGAVWIGHAAGLSVIRDGQVQLVYPVAGGRPSSVLALAPAADGGGWAGTYNRGVPRVTAGGGLCLLTRVAHPPAGQQLRAP